MTRLLDARACPLVPLVIVLPTLLWSLPSGGEPAAAPAAKRIRLDPGGEGYQQILSGPPESFTMRSGLVVLAPGRSVGKHSTEEFEELVVVLEGEGEMRITGGKTLSLRVGYVAYCPSHEEHDVVNTGSTLLRYLYVVARAE